MTLGSEVAEPVCDIAVPLRPHSSSIDKIATAGLATKGGENLMVMSSPNRDGHAIPMRTIAHIQLAKFEFRTLGGQTRTDAPHYADTAIAYPG